MNFKRGFINSLIVLLIWLYLVAATCVGDWCYLHNGQIGTCQHISVCQSAQRELKYHQEPVICGYYGSYYFPIVCCQQNDYNPGPDHGPTLGPTQDNYPRPEQGPNLGPTLDKAQGSDQNPAQGSTQGPSQEIAQSTTQVAAEDSAKMQAADLAEQKCDEFFEIVRKQGGSFAAVGGVDALPMEHPHMAILGYGGGGNVEWGCGGSLISQEYVLTAGHCLFSRIYGDVTDVRLGDLDIGSTTDDASPQDFKVVQTIPHPNYSTDSTYHDIALLKLDRPANFTKYVRPACLQTTHKLYAVNLTATGWGATYFGGGTHSFLQKVQLNELPVKTCQATYKPDTRLLRGVDQELQICAGNLEEVMDTCQGDSGGPLQKVAAYFPLFHRIVGVTSFGKNCGLVPAVYTRVSAYLPWITSVVWP